MNPFDAVELEPHEIKAAYDKNPDPNPFDKMEMQESWGKTIVRTLYQIPSGLAQAFTYPLDLLLLAGAGEQDIDDEIMLAAKAQELGIPFDREKYREAQRQAIETFPTQSNIERQIEEGTGLPLTPKTKLQKGVKFASTVGAFTPGTLSQKAAGGLIAEGGKEGLEALGVPESVAELAAFPAGVVAGGKTPPITIGKQVKPSGLPVRRFEAVKDPTTVTPGRAAVIDQKLESDFRKVSDNILKETPVGKTGEILAADPSYKAKVSDLFEDVQALADDIPGSTSTADIKTKVKQNIDSRKGKGLVASEYDREYETFMKKFDKEIPKEATAAQKVEQYRKNNAQLREIYEPGKSRGFNRAKKDALLEQNRILAESIENDYPGTEFSKLFKDSNKQWAEIKNVEFVNEFIDQMFEGKVDFKKGGKFWDENVRSTFQRALGKEGYKNFEQLMGDFLESGRARALIKTAEAKGFGDLARMGASFLLHPKAAAGYALAKEGKVLYQMLLDKPRLVLKWDKGIKAMKQEKFGEAQKIFGELEKEANLTKQEAVQSAKEAGFGRADEELENIFIKNQKKQ